MAGKKLSRKAVGETASLIARMGSLTSSNSSDDPISDDEGRSKQKQRRWSAGHLVALAIFFGGLAATIGLESYKLYDATGGKPLAGTTCPVPPTFEPTDAEVLGPLTRYPKFDLSTPFVRKYARLIHGYLEPWMPIKGATSGLGSAGIISPEALHGLAMQPAVMSCNGHIRVIDGKVFYRYGGFWHVYYRLHRFLQTVKMIQDAIDRFGLTDLKLELFVNTCDHPQSFYSGHWPDREGYPIMSTGFTVDTLDIPIPDPLDLTPSYTPDLSKQIPWDKKDNRAVFRGKTTNFQMFDGNWGANPRVRLHRMSDVPENKGLMDCHINSWSHADEKTQEEMKRDGVHLAHSMKFEQFNAFKYQVIVDGGGGSCRTCGVLRSNQMSFRQKTPLLQFYEPLLEDNVHWLVVQRSFDDLPERIRRIQKNDSFALKVVENANNFATYACTLRGRTLYWAILLVKYQEALMNPEKIEAPAELCKDTPLYDSPPVPKNPALVSCKDPEAAKKQVPCAFFCAGGQIPEEKFIWLRADEHLKNFKGVGPP